MKKKLILLAVVVMTGLAAVITGCKKEENPQRIHSLNVGDEQIGEKEAGGGDQMRLRTLYHVEPGYYYDSGTGAYHYFPFDWMFCFWPKENCLSTVVVTDNERGVPSDENVKYVDEFLSAYERQELDMYFKSGKYLQLFPAIDEIPEAVEGIGDGNIVFHLWHNQKDSTDFYLGIPKDLQISSNVDEWIDEVKCVLRIKDLR